MTSRIKDASLISPSSSKELEKFTVDALREYLKKHSLATTGTKEVVIKRIRDNKNTPDVDTKENSNPNLSDHLEKLSVSATKNKKRNSKEIESTDKTQEKTLKKKGKGVQFNSQSERVHVFDRADPPASNIYDVFGDRKSAPSVFDEDARKLIKRAKKDRRSIQIATEGVSNSIFSLHDISGREEVRRDTEDLTIKELREELRERGSATHGTRRELIDRLDECILGHPKQKKVKKDAPSWLTWD